MTVGALKRQLGQYNDDCQVYVTADTDRNNTKTWHSLATVDWHGGSDTPPAGIYVLVYATPIAENI